MSQLIILGRNSIQREYIAKIVLALLFLIGIGLFAVSAGPEKLSRAISSLTAIDLILFSLATFRLGRLVAYDRVMEPLRYPFTRTVPDDSGAGESVEPKGEGERQAIGQMLTCPVCAGTWVAAGLVFAFVWFPDLTRLFLWMTAAIGLAEVLQAATEALSWGGQLNRNLAGKNQSGRSK